MSYSEAQEALIQEMHRIWGDSDTFAVENQTYTFPSNKPWVRVSVVESVGDQLTQGKPGNRRVNYTGLVIVEISTKAGSGTRASSDLVDRITKDFSYRRLPGTGIVIDGLVKRIVGPTDNGFYQVDLDFSYRREEFI